MFNSGNEIGRKFKTYGPKDVRKTNVESFFLLDVNTLPLHHLNDHIIKKKKKSQKIRTVILKCILDI